MFLQLPVKIERKSKKLKVKAEFPRPTLFISEYFFVTNHLFRHHNYSIFTGVCPKLPTKRETNIQLLAQTSCLAPKFWI